MGDCYKRRLQTTVPSRARSSSGLAPPEIWRRDRHVRLQDVPTGFSRPTEPPRAGHPRWHLETAGGTLEDPADYSSVSIGWISRYGSRLS